MAVVGPDDVDCGACAATQTVSALDRETARADAAERELERWRHGKAIEGDFVCPNALQATNAERDLNAARVLLAEALDLAAEGLSYTPDYYRQKWGLDEQFAKLRAAQAKLNR